MFPQGWVGPEAQSGHPVYSQHLGLTQVFADGRSKWSLDSEERGVHTGCQVVSYQLYPVPRGAGDSPRTLLLAGVLVGPVGTGDGATAGCQLVLAAGCGMRRGSPGTAHPDVSWEEGVSLLPLLCSASCPPVLRLQNRLRTHMSSSFSYPGWGENLLTWFLMTPWLGPLGASDEVVYPFVTTWPHHFCPAVTHASSPLPPGSVCALREAMSPETLAPDSVVPKRHSCFHHR